MGLGLLFPVLTLISLIVFIIVLIKQFKHGGALQGIIGIITCGLWTFIWGWIKHKSLALTKIMIIWTIIQLTPFVLMGVFGAAIMGEMYKLVGDIAGDPSLLMKQDQSLKKKSAPIKLPKRRVKKAVLHYNDKRIHDSLPGKISPNKFNRTAKNYKVVEEIYAPNRVTLKEKSSYWPEKSRENDLICSLT